MKVESIAIPEADLQFPLSSGSAQVKHEQGFRRDEPEAEQVLQRPEQEEKKVSPTEILNRIREISQDGLYSVRFEKSEEINQLIVKVVDRKTEEVIRQIPPETILGAKASLNEFLGNIVNQYS